MEATGNMQKYENYTEQLSRLNRALKASFYFEAVFIEYAILEDRTESALRHTGVFREDKHNTLNAKLNRLDELRRRKKSVAQKYFSDELIAEIRVWKDRRNQFVHALLNQKLTTDDLADFASEGQRIVKQLSNKVRSYNRAIDKEREESTCQN